MPMSSGKKLSQTFTCAAIFILSMLVSGGCDLKKRNIKQALQAFEQTIIALPSDMGVIQDGKMSEMTNPTDIPILIRYVGAEECSNCQITHLMEEDTLFRMAEESGLFQYMIILSPPFEDLIQVKENLMEARFHHPVYLDVNGTFELQNVIPKDRRMHTFLLDTMRRPIFVGDPLASESLMNVFCQALKR